jgi:hypothetical protein
MERGGKVSYHTEPVDDSIDRKIIANVLDRFEEFDSFEVDAAKVKKFMEEKRHKIKRQPKKPTKIYEDKKVENTELKDVNTISKKSSKIKDNNDVDVEEEKILSKKPTKIMDDVNSEEEVVVTPKKSIPKKPTKIDKVDEIEEEIETNKSKPKKPTKIKDKKDGATEDQEEKTLSRIQLLNQELFKENSNKSRNEDIKAAWKTLQEYELPNKDNLIIKKSHPGHFVTMGCSTGSLKNPHWLVMDKNTTEEYYIMYCEKDGYTKFSIEDYYDVINPEDHIYPTWSYHSTGYIASRSYRSTDTMTYLHQVICKKYNKKKISTLSVDHKNRDKLDNRKENLRFATQSEQNQNTDKRNRKYNAKPLPEGLTQDAIPKYVLYYSEKYGPNKDKFREWLNVEKHPKQNGKKWSTSKAMQISIQEKLEQAKAKLEELNL